MPKKNHKSNASLGKAIQNKHMLKFRPKTAETLEGETTAARTFKVHVSDAPASKGPQLKSILEQNSLDEFMQYAEMSQKKFTSDRYEAREILQSCGQVIQIGGEEASTMISKFLTEANVRNPQYRPLKIPRRPEWTKGMTGLEINQQENLAFLEWRRDLAAVEEGNINLAITPFEKNIEVWKQLWRVIEKSDLLLQIVDARNPYFYYSEDLEKYISETSAGKPAKNDASAKSGGSDDDDEEEDDDSDEEEQDETDNKQKPQTSSEAQTGESKLKSKNFLLCINKADYLSDELIAHWNKYFTEKGVNHIFISAKKEQEKLDAEDDESEEDDSDEQEEQAEEQEKDFEPMFGELKTQIDLENEKKEEDQKSKPPKPASQPKEDEDEKKVATSTTKIFSRDDVLAYLRMRAQEMGRSHKDRLNVGTVGYPNVGKSSLINVLCGRKRVGVAAMPGKTKHFQTLLLESTERDICLVDCPGLVFPSFANSKAEMYCCGVLPIHTITEYMQPVALITARVSKEALEHHYKIKMPPRDSKSYTANTFLTLFAVKKGWLTGSGNPNLSQAARQALNDYTSGQIVFCHVRPDYLEDKHGVVQQSGFKLKNAPEEEQVQQSQEQPDEQTVSSMPSQSTAPGERDLAQRQQSLQALLPENKAQAAVVASVLDEEGVFEAQLDKAFFHESSNKGQKVKLTKADKRALKFMARREGADGAEVVFESDSAHDLNAVKHMLTTDKRFKKGGKNRFEAGALLDGSHRK